MTRITEKELKSVSGLGPFDRYRYFIKRIAGTSTIWLLKNANGDYALSEMENKILLSVWSAMEYTQSCLNGIWQTYFPTSLDIDEFNETVIPIIHEKEYLIDVFPVSNKTGFVLTLDEFIHDLNMELENY